MQPFIPILAMIPAIALATSDVQKPGPDGDGKMQASVQKSEFGKMPDGTTVDAHTLTNAKGMKVKIIAYGGIITEIHVPDKDGKFDDVVLGFDNLKQYLDGHPYFGCITGRVANRIAKGKFTLDGKEYTVATNNGPNHLHGGNKGFDKAVWKAREEKRGDGVAVRLDHTSPDGDEGYPGNLRMTVVYVLTPNNELRIEYTATTDKPTPVNLTNHTYFNLGGSKEPTILGHELLLNAKNHTPMDETSIPTGEIESVEGTPLDFQKATAIGSRIDRLKGEPGGYDHNYVLNAEKNPKLVAIGSVFDPKTGRLMEASTSEPGVQLYTGNYLDGKLTGKGGMIYKKHAGLCLEAQHFPDAVNQSKFPSVILQPGKAYKQTTIYKFSAAKDGKVKPPA